MKRFFGHLLLLFFFLTSHLVLPAPFNPTINAYAATPTTPSSLHSTPYSHSSSTSYQHTPKWGIESAKYEKNKKESCSRTAYVGLQEVAIDNGPINKGQGLKYYLDQDPVSQKLLFEYENNGRPKWPQIALGSLGTSLTIAGLAQSGSLTQNSDSSKRKQLFIFTGITTLLLNYLISKATASNNEKKLYEAVDEYNKRNIPKIYFSPGAPYSDSPDFLIDTKQED